MKDNETIDIKTWNFEEEIRKTVAENDDIFVVPTFEHFFTTDELEDIAINAQTVAAWDFNTALGDTIKEKYESLYVKLVEVTNVLLAKGAKGYFWIATSPSIASIFETATCGFWPTYNERDKIGGVFPMGLPQVSYIGAINSKWRLYADPTLKENQVIVGCNDTLEDYSHYARMVVTNWVI